MSEKSIDLQSVLDEGKFGALRIFVFAVCFLILLLDGYDTQALGAIAPAVMRDLQLSPKEFGLVFGLGGAGVLTGAITFGTLGDIYGRKLLLTVSLAIFGGFSILMATATSGTELTIYRVLSSVGLGGAVPNVLALASEYTPKRMRAASVTILWSALPAGGIVGSFASAWLTPAFGWHSVYIFGGVLPLIVAVVMILSMPESVVFLAAKGQAERVRAIVRKLRPELTLSNETDLNPIEQVKKHNAPIAKIFQDGRTFGTVTLWILFFMSFCSILTIVAWSTNLVASVGFTQPQASGVLGWFNFGSLVASVSVGALIDRFGATRILPIYFVAMSAAIMGLGFTMTGPYAVVAAAFVVVGFFAGGSNSGMMALCALFYPATMRSTGLGWSYGWGRVGAMTGPFIGGLIVAMKWEVASFYIALGVPAAIAAFAALFLTRSTKAASIGSSEVVRPR